MKHNLWLSPEKTHCIYLFESGKCFLTGQIISTILKKASAIFLGMQYFFHTNFYLMLWIFASQKNLIGGIDFS